ncbi:RNA polymerase sigma factor SigK [Sphaerisporangium siamense]|uniref:RNA polymerase sigma-70 factor (ECF subfamily) n=1 Tax=Sphaerisporangium siamense TaxID=795645 RepID=A0A7W7GD97_9ACTN|nr:sigma-70 family RNA polymerase sigma factor [Sphaerisporangium siamense]MBB4702791.1 RNA polymerase sigma-70 factor (ECF subfamily) [Sphaerisporangium siamense]GII83455.1 RNA polymerase sigma factor SigK [Sphaerisporangium siamense]
METPGTDDRSLHQRVVGGDESALGEVHTRHYPLVLSLALRVTRDRVVAEDIVQEVFVTFWERPLAFDPDRGTLRSWLATIAHRRAVDHVRSEQRHRVSVLGPRLTDPEPSPSPLEDWVLAADEAARVRRAVARLPGGLREPIELAYYRGRTYRQTAEDLGLPEGTVKSRIRMGLRRLADELAEEEV